MSIVRIGMAEDDKFGTGYDAIFGTASNTAKKPAAKASATKKPAKPAKKPVAKKGAAKKK